MHTRTALLSIGGLALIASLGACVGNIGDHRDLPGGFDASGSSNPFDPDDPNGPDGPTTQSDSFRCNEEAAALTPAPIRRLAKTFVQHAVEELFSPLDDTSRAAFMAAIQTRLDLMPADNFEFFSTNDPKVTQDHVDGLFGLALGVATNVEDPTYAKALAQVCGAGSDESALQDDACLRTFVEYYGRKAFRRPLTPAETDDFASFYKTASAEGLNGMSAVMARLVAHPNFYYRFDSEGEIVSGTEGDGAVYALTKWELLSKITFLFWAGPPTDALYDRVASTDISQDDALRSLLNDVLADPKAERGILSFYGEWLELEKTKNPATEGNVLAGQALVAAAGLDELPATHRQDMMQEVLDLAKHYTLTTEGTFRDILTSPYSFARTPALASIYGVEPWDGSPDRLVSLPEGERSGLLTRAAMIASNSEHTSPILKGKLVRTRVLCDEIPPPPANLNIEPLVHSPDRTTREAVEDATSADTCQACHQFMNPLGFATENYDPIGRLRDKELFFAEGTDEVVSQLDVDTNVEAALSSGEIEAIADGVELSERIAESGKADTCLVQNYFEFVTGRAQDPEADGCDLVSLRDALVGTDGSLKAMIVESVMQESFRRRMTE